MNSSTGIFQRFQLDFKDAVLSPLHAPIDPPLPLHQILKSPLMFSTSLGNPVRCPINFYCFLCRFTPHFLLFRNSFRNFELEIWNHIPHLNSWIEASSSAFFKVFIEEFLSVDICTSIRPLNTKLSQQIYLEEFTHLRAIKPVMVTSSH